MSQTYVNKVMKEKNNVKEIDFGIFNDNVVLFKISSEINLLTDYFQ